MAHRIDKDASRRRAPRGHSWARPVAAALSATVGACSGVLVASELPAAADWSSSNCNGSATAIQPRPRSLARDLAQGHYKEGYEWGGGCYVENDRDDTPNAPDSNGEGNDCSGFVFRHWSLVESGNDWKYYYSRFWVHGPYNTLSFKNPSEAMPFKDLGKAYADTTYWDALVYNSNGAGHIGLIHTEGTGGSDWISEAKSDASGTGLFYQPYRSQSAYQGVMREGWPS